MIIWAQTVNKITGQSKVTDAVIGLRLHTHLIRFSLSFSYILAVIKLYLIVISNRSQMIYFVPSRSYLGMLKDLPILLLSLFGVKVIAHLHGSDVVKFLTVMKRYPVLRYAYKRMSYISPSEIITKALQEKCYRCVTIENFYDNSDLHRSKPWFAEDVILENKYLIVWNSNIMASKGVFEVLEAVENLYALGSDVHLCLFGVPIADNEMELCEVRNRLIDYTGKAFVSYFGARPKHDVYSVLERAHTVALPSRYPTECQPLGLIEAMLQNCNVVVANRDVLIETVGRYENVIVVDPTTESISSGLLQSINLPLKQCDSVTRDRFSFSRFSREFKSFLQLVESTVK